MPIPRPVRLLTAPTGASFSEAIEALTDPLRRFWDCLRFLASLPTTCQHRNRHNLTPYKVACWECGRVRNYTRDFIPSPWHKEAR